MPIKGKPIPSLAPKFPLTLLMVEDNPADAELCVEFLSGAQFDVTAQIVTTRDEFVGKLQTGNFDIVLADYHLGAWTGMEAFDAMQEIGSDVPFILMTAALGEQTAVECMRRGVADYILKDRLDRLPVAICRALEQRAGRLERHRAQRNLEQAETRFRALADYMPTAVFIEHGSKCNYANRAAEAITGYTRQELTAMGFWRLVTPEAMPVVLNQRRKARSANLPVRCRAQITTKWGSERWLEFTVRLLEVDGAKAEMITAVPIPVPRPIDRSADMDCAVASVN